MTCAYALQKVQSYVLLTHDKPYILIEQAICGGLVFYNYNDKLIIVSKSCCFQN